MNVVPIVPPMDIPKQLRDLADHIEEVGGITRVTLVHGTDVYSWGPVSADKAAEGAVFDLTLALHKLMGYTVPKIIAQENDECP